MTRQGGRPSSASPGNREPDVLRRPRADREIETTSTVPDGITVLRRVSVVLSKKNVPARAADIRRACHLLSIRTTPLAVPSCADTRSGEQTSHLSMDTACSLDDAASQYSHPFHVGHPQAGAGQPSGSVIRGIQRRLASGEASATDIAQHYLTLAEASQPTLGSFISLSRDAALAAAANVDAARKAGKALGPLAGVPIAVKARGQRCAPHLHLLPPSTPICTAVAGRWCSFSFVRQAVRKRRSSRQRGSRCALPLSSLSSGQHLHPRRPDHRRQQDPRGIRPALRRDRDGEARSRRRRPHRCVVGPKNPLCQSKSSLPSPPAPPAPADAA